MRYSQHGLRRLVDSARHRRVATAAGVLVLSGMLIGCSTDSASDIRGGPQTSQPTTVSKDAADESLPALESTTIPRVQEPSEDAARELFALMEASIEQTNSSGVTETYISKCLDPNAESGERTAIAEGVYNPAASGTWKGIVRGNHKEIVFPNILSDQGYNGPLTFYSSPEFPPLVVEKVGDNSWILDLRDQDDVEPYLEEVFPIRLDATDGLITEISQELNPPRADIFTGLEGPCLLEVQLNYSLSPEQSELVNALNAAAVAAFEVDGSPTPAQEARIEAFIEGRVKGWQRACQDISDSGATPNDFTLDGCTNEPEAEPWDGADRAPVTGTPEQVYEYSLGRGWYKAVENYLDPSAQANLNPPYLLCSLSLGVEPETFRLMQSK